MKAGTMRIRSKGHHPAGAIQIKNEKNRPSLKTVKNDNKSEKSKYKPLWGKVFYLDLPSLVISERLEKDLKELGGRVEEFLSKDISYLISNKKEAKYAQTLRCISPVPSPESTCTGGNSSPHPSYDGSSFKTPDPVCMSRGKLLVEKAIKEHELIPSNSILSNALSWGVKILHIDDIKCYIEQKKKELYLIKKSNTSLREAGKRLGIQKTKTGRLKKPFVKVEDSSHHYRPFYLQLSNIPLINYSVPKPCSPFDLDKTSSLQKQAQAKQRNRTGCEPDDGRCPRLQPRLKENKKKGYCECCSQKYEALQAHLLSEQHRSFAQSTRYQVVDDIISKLVYDFVEYESNISRRVKCGIASFTPILGNTFKRNEPEKQLELHHISPNEPQGNTTKQLIKQDLHYQESPDPLPKVAFSSEPIDSFASCSPYNSTSKLGEHLDCRKSYIMNPAKKDIKLDLVQLPLNNDTQGYTPQVSDHKEIINEKDLEELKTECCPYVLETFMHISDFDETDKNVSQLKRKSESPLFPDTHQKKKGSSSPPSHGSRLRVLSNSPEQPAGQDKMISHSHVGEELQEADVTSTDSLPSGKLHRKVKIVLGRNKKRSQKKNVELHLKNTTEFPAPKEENCICSSPVQSLVELFQTSEDKSEFLGFTSSSENHASCDVLEVWEEENGNGLSSMFLSSPSSPSTFTGF